MARTALEEVTGLYGRYSDREGVLIDRTDRLAPTLRGPAAANGAAWVVEAPTGATARVLCGEIVETIDIEGFRGDGRCGLPVTWAEGACPAHAAERAAWRAEEAL